jgi:membrane-bound lytic murein transglycosylase D
MISSFPSVNGVLLFLALFLQAGNLTSAKTTPSSLSKSFDSVFINDTLSVESILESTPEAYGTTPSDTDGEDDPRLPDTTDDQVIPSLAVDSVITKNELSADSNTTFVIGPDDPIVAMLDSLASLKVFLKLNELSGDGVERTRDLPPEYIPAFPDSVYQKRISLMDDNSPFHFVYNGWVRSYIELYSSRRRDLTERMLGLGALYFPFFEEQLDRFNIPLELKYLAVVESALNPVARSRAGATGIWQFMYHTGRLYGLNTSSLVDDRNDVTLATIAACRHLVDLYNIYEDWSLVLAAYNAGPGNVNRAIRRSGGVKDFWLIRPYLPRETQNYVPAFIAVAYVMEHAEYHNLYPVPPLYTHHDVDTIHVTKQLSLRTLSELLEIDLEYLRFLNPAYRQNIIPKREDNPYVLFLPNDHARRFLANEEDIYNFRSPEVIRQEELAKQLAETTVYVVVRGDNLGSIARRHNTSVREIQALNNLRGTLIRPGQRLIVRAPAPAASAASTASGDANVHVVRRGETLGIIANRYRISVNNLMRWNNLTGTVIHPGQQLRVRPPSDA